MRTGLYHLDKGLGCEDFFGYSLSGNFSILVVADGAGSSSQARQGSERVVDNTLSWFEGLDTKTLVEDSHEELLERDLLPFLISEAKFGASQYSTAAVGLVDSSAQQVSVLTVGDSGVVLIDLDESLYVQTEIKQPGQQPNETVFIGMNNPEYIVQGFTNISALSLMSDGIIDHVVKGGQALRGFWVPYFSRVKEQGVEKETISLMNMMESREMFIDDATLLTMVIE